ncbi:hypothetical protein DYB28_001382 [Aphanomyces astaci]|uniref:Uncharacterized protein n=1 Tax=Aphanomyces astaci TaxID=112090 RepID=A0A9X8H4F6_APHAT|nr:hypothetical protein DYB28_001382 [Aphanomyces astaci]
MTPTRNTQFGSGPYNRRPADRHAVVAAIRKQSLMLQNVDKLQLDHSLGHLDGLQVEFELLDVELIRIFEQDETAALVDRQRGKQGKMTKVSKRIWVPRGGPAGRPVASENPIIRPDGEENKEQTDDPGSWFLPVPREDPRMGREETRTDGVEVKTRWDVLRSVKKLCEKTRR